VCVCVGVVIATQCTVYHYHLYGVLLPNFSYPPRAVAHTECLKEVCTIGTLLYLHTASSSISSLAEYGTGILLNRRLMADFNV